MLLGTQKRIAVALSVLTISLCAVLVSTIGYSYKESASHVNRLALGENSSAELVSIPYYRPMSFNGLTRDEILKFRKDIVEATPELLLNPYVPTDSVFRIDDNLNWFGLEGLYAYVTPMRATVGRSYESKFILNPFLLVGIEFWGLTGWGKNGFLWDSKKINRELLQSSDFPYYCKPGEIEWSPARSEFKVTYRLQDHIKKVNQYAATPLKPEFAQLGLIGYNARDFGYHYIYVDERHSNGILVPRKVNKPLALTDRVQAVAACPVPGGCHYHHQSTLQYDDIQVTDFPATLVIKLWQEEPISPQQVADLTERIEIL